jgi:hypothetical protein
LGRLSAAPHLVRAWLPFPARLLPPL